MSNYISIDKNTRQTKLYKNIILKVLKLKIELDINEIKRFINNNGIDPYESCPCGSGVKYKWCCKPNTKRCSNSNEIKYLYHNLKSEVWNRRKWKPMKCHWYNCTEDTQQCHSIQNNRFLNQICGARKEVYHFIPKGTIGSESMELHEEPIFLASTFNGFCNKHDTELFAIIEASNPIVFSNEQLYAFVYRNYYYMLLKKEIIQSIIFRTSIQATPQYYQKDYKPRSSHDAQMAVDLILDLRKNQIMHDELLEVIKDIESNYDENQHTWSINNHCMVFSDIRKLKLNNANFCFQTVREYILKSEADSRYTSATIDNYKNKRFNHISTIVLPCSENNEIEIFFSISNKHQTPSPYQFIEHVNTCPVLLLMLTKNFKFQKIKCMTCFLMKPKSKLIMCY